MTSQQKQLVRQTFSQVVPIAEQAAALFYRRLFELDPALRPLFKNDINAQGKKLIEMLAFCLSKLDDPEELLPAVKHLGRKHVAYGVRDAHYDTVGSALLWTLEAGLGPSFTLPAREAWTAVYEVLAATMKEGAREA